MKIYQLFFYVYVYKKVLLNNFMKRRDKVLKGLTDSALKKSYCHEFVSLTAGSSTSNYYLKEKSSYLPAILVGCWLLYCCTVSHFSIYRLGYFSFSFMLPVYHTRPLHRSRLPCMCFRRAYVRHFMGWSLDLYRPGDQTEK